ncbi:MAG: TIM barrel protein, partial [Planctomycetota bacterium]
MQVSQQQNVAFSRRALFSGAAAACAGGVLSAGGPTAQAAEPKRNVPPEDYRVANGRIKQSGYGWCFRPMPAEELIHACHRMGLPAMDVGRSNYSLLKKLGMKLTMSGAHGFTKGPFSRENHPFCIQKLREGIDGAVECDCANVITFTGMRAKGITDQQGAQNCVDCWKEVIGYAE